MRGKNVSVPIEALLAAISKVLHENLGSRFDLEITEKEVEPTFNKPIRIIDINLRIEAPVETVENY